MTMTLPTRAQNYLELADAYALCKCTVHDRWGGDGDAVGRCVHERAFEQACDEAAAIIREQAAVIAELLKVAKRLAADADLLADDEAAILAKHQGE